MRFSNSLKVHEYGVFSVLRSLMDPVKQVQYTETPGSSYVMSWKRQCTAIRFGNGEGVVFL